MKKVLTFQNTQELETKINAEGIGQILSLGQGICIVEESLVSDAVAVSEVSKTHSDGFVETVKVTKKKDQDDQVEEKFFDAQAKEITKESFDASRKALEDAKLEAQVAEASAEDANVEVVPTKEAPVVKARKENDVLITETFYVNGTRSLIQEGQFFNKRQFFGVDGLEMPEDHFNQINGLNNDNAGNIQ